MTSLGEQATTTADGFEQADGELATKIRTAVER